MSTSAVPNSVRGWRTAEPGQRRLLLIEFLALAVVPTVLVAKILVTVYSSHWVAYDFHLAYYPAAARLLHGGDPYAATRYQIANGVAFVYPALSAVLLVPFALLSHGTADHLYSLLCLVLVPTTLWSMGVRDWRVYGAVMIWLPVTVGWQGGNVSVPLACLSALAWRHRDRPWVAGLLTAAAISIKPFVWPLSLWLLATRRWRASAWALAWGLILNLLSWWLVGFDRLPIFLRLSGEDASRFWHYGYGVMAVARYLGLGHGAAQALMVVACVPAAAGVVVLGRRGLQERAFMLAVALMLLASPLVWSHYFTFLVLPLALSRPRFNLLWLVPLAMWVCPPSTTVVGWQAAIAWIVGMVCITASLRAEPRAKWSVARGRRRSEGVVAVR